MKCLVTGGSGFIGSNLVAFLLQKGHKVTVVDNLSTGYKQNIATLDVDFVEGDIRDGDLIKHLVPGKEAIFHLGASVGNARSIKDPFKDAEVNIIGTLNLLEAAQKNEVSSFVFSSSAGIFGELKTLPIKENHPVEPDSPYGASKLGAEKLCLAYNKLYGLKVVCLRYFNVYGVNQRYDAYGNVIPIFAYRMINHQPVTIFGDGEQTRDFVHVQDVVQANYKASITAGVTGAFNIASGRAITINHLVELMGTVSQLAPKVIYESPRKGDVRHSRADISAAGESFGYQPEVDLETGLREYMSWARDALLV